MRLSSLLETIFRSGCVSARDLLLICAEVRGSISLKRTKMHIFHSTSGFKGPNISRNTRCNCNFSLPFKKLPLKLPVIQTISAYFAKIAHKIAKSKYFSNIFDDSDSPIDSLSDDIQFVGVT